MKIETRRDSLDVFDPGTKVYIVAGRFVSEGRCPTCKKDNQSFRYVVLSDQYIIVGFSVEENHYTDETYVYYNAESLDLANYEEDVESSCVFLSREAAEKYCGDANKI